MGMTRFSVFAEYIIYSSICVGVGGVKKNKKEVLDVSLTHALLKFQRLRNNEV